MHQTGTTDKLHIDPPVLERQLKSNKDSFGGVGVGVCVCVCVLTTGPGSEHLRSDFNCDYEQSSDFE